ncbi:disulfide bond formation protein B [Nitrospirillum viridazoti]|uniref:Disulfide bond formation protein DsbB n=1 Tax=Nitrospirillum amazonense TaxID=28077 RepID=A0A560I182_9PROT|nr:disulfide bond formation protein B [Nitrospirillum amazonense]TWB52677.1 disulfide bond formation protein DsbB [Nitrospirillum amazonense]
MTAYAPSPTAAPSLLAHPRLPQAALVLASVGALGTALLSQYVGGLHPCEFCMWQRWAYVAAIVALLPGLANPRFRTASLALGGLAFLTGAAIAGFHAGVEQHWWEGFTTCSSSMPKNLTLDQLRERLLSAPLVRCDEAQWTFHGISMAAFNFPASLVLGLVAWAAARAGAKRA